VKVDVDIFPEISNKYNIITTGIYSQLPVIIMFKNGEIEDIYPGKDSKGNLYVAKYYREKELVKFFDLENIYLNSVNFVPKAIKQTKP
jgi:hypothetical protein